MKAKSLFSLAIIVMALAGCSENEITEQNPDANKPIGFDTYTAAQARGAENGLPAVKTSGFGVMAYQTNGAYSTAGAKSEFMNNQKVTWNSSGNAWVYSPVKFWPAVYQPAHCAHQPAIRQGAFGAGKEDGKAQGARPGQQELQGQTAQLLPGEKKRCHTTATPFKKA